MILYKEQYFICYENFVYFFYHFTSNFDEIHSPPHHSPSLFQPELSLRFPIASLKYLQMIAHQIVQQLEKQEFRYSFLEDLVQQSHLSEVDLSSIFLINLVLIPALEEHYHLKFYNSSSLVNFPYYFSLRFVVHLFHRLIYRVGYLWSGCYQLKIFFPG